MPAEDDALPGRGPARALDAGTDGRILLDRICAQAAAHLNPGGAVMLVQNDLIGIEPTVEGLERTGLRVDVVERHHGPLGPVLTARAELLEARGMLEPGVREEDVVVVRGVAA
jgi:release factor glutamine methyltransferase